MLHRAPAISPALPGVLIAWGVAVALVGVGGEFPLSDDWAYAHVVRSLCEGRGFDFLPWTGASLVLQALYGAAACKLAGFSHETLRATTLVLSVLGIASFHALLRQLGASVRTATAGSVVLAFSPLWFSLSFTFMTDVPFAALAITAAWLYVRAFGRRSRSGLLLAGTVAAASFLVRQHALSIAVAAAAAALWPSPDTSRSRAQHSPSGDARSRHDHAPLAWSARLLDAAAALALPLVTAAAYTLWVATGTDVPLAVHNKLGEAVTTSPLAMAGAAFRGLSTLGFLFLPWALTMRLDARGERRVFAGVLAALAAVAAFLFVREGASMFYLTNVLDDFSVGAVTTRDALFLAQPAGPGAGAFFHAVLTALSLASAAALVARLATALPAARTRESGMLESTTVVVTSAAQAAGTRRVSSIAVGRASLAVIGATRDARPALFCMLALLLSALGTLVQAHYYFDRYLLVLLPLAIASVVAVSPPPRLAWGLVAALAAMSFYSIAGTHDYMQWNRARWSLLTELEASGVTPRQIDGGVEYNAARLAALLRTAPTDAQARSGQPASAKSWWWVVDDEWIVAFREIDGYAPTDSRRYSRWLPPGEGRVLTLRRRSSTPAPANGDAGREQGPRSGGPMGTR